MSRVRILVEGQTEEKFVKNVLAPYLAQESGVFLEPTILTTKRVKAGSHFKGGFVSYQKAKNDLTGLFGDTSAAMITTMLDLYGLPSDFPGIGNVPQGDCYARAAYLEQAFGRDIDNHRFRPYLSIHEFEALLFSEPREIANPFSNAQAANELERIRRQFASPEEIDNDDPPARRIKTLLPSYRKVADGLSISQRIGLDRMREECAHFNEWVTELENLG